MSAPRDVPLTEDQRAMWTLQRLHPDHLHFNVGYAVSVDDPLHPAELRRALDAVVERHEMLRTTFHAPDGRPVQRIHATVSLPIDVREVGAIDDAALTDVVERQILRPIDLERGPVVRMTLYLREQGEQVLLVDGHHIVFDLFSLRIFVEELEAHVAAGRAGEAAPLEPLPIQFREYAALQRRELEGEALRSHEAYWRDQLAGEAPDLAMPLDHSRPPRVDPAGEARPVELPAELVRRLERLGRENESTLHSVLFAGFAALLHRYSGQSPITLGVYSGGRMSRDSRPLIGPLSHAFPLRFELDGGSFAELVRDTRRRVLQALRHEGYPYALMAERLRPSRDPSRNPIFQAAFNLDHQKPAWLRAPRWRSGPWIPMMNRSQRGQLELKLMATRREDGSVAAALQYQTALYEAATVDRLVASWAALLESAAGDPHRPVRRLRVQSGAEERRMLVEWNTTKRTYPTGVGVHELVLDQARRTPEREAVRHGGSALRYRELVGRARCLAAALRARGAGPGAVLGVCLPPCVEQVVTLLAVLETGASYLPLDPAHPARRRRDMLEDARALLVIGGGSTLEGLAPTPLLEYRDLESAAVSHDESSSGSHGADLRMYVIFTSGSTGRPKGVEVSHRSFVNLLYAMQELLELDSSDTWLSVTTITFDIAALEIFLPLITGARVVLAAREVAGNGRRLAEEIERFGATVLQATPTSWHLLQETRGRPTRPLRRLCGGEAMTRNLADRMLRDPGPVWNAYGPTETTVWSTAWRVRPGARLPAIGRPLANTRVYVLDEELQPVPVGVVGELWIAGDGVALGYLHRPELTAERFVPEPFEPGEGRMYGTGDLARWLPSGELEHLGREDRQVKIRGIRVELGEIEAALLEHPEVAEAVVAARTTRAGEGRLAAYLVAKGAQIDVAGLRRWLSERLPEIMIPSTFTLLPALPLTPNRKVDRRALPEPVGGVAATGPHTPPRTEVEASLAELVAEVLELERVGIDDDFFDIGGASITSLELAMRAEELGIGFPPEWLFEHPTIRDLAAALEPSAAGQPQGGDEG